MRIELIKEDFKKALNICEKLTRKNLTLPILQNILLKTDGSFLELNVTNLESAVSWRILSKIEKQGKVLVSAGVLTNLVNLISDEKIELTENNGNLVLVGKNENIQIQGQDSEEFPLIPKIAAKKYWQVPTSVMVQGLASVVDISSASQTRIEISGTYFSFKKNKLKIVGTDSFRLAEKTIQLIQSDNQDGSFILPQSSSRELLNILNQQGGAVKIYLDPNQVLFEIASESGPPFKISFLSRLIEAEYPNYQEIIPKKYITQIRLAKEEFVNQIKKASLFSGKIAEVKINVLSKENKVRIFAQSSDVGKGDLSCSCSIEGQDVQVSFNHRFLIDGLNNIKSSEVLFELHGEDKAGVLRSVGDTSYFYILMPIKS